MNEFYLKQTFINTLFPVHRPHQLFATAYVIIMYFIFENIYKYTLRLSIYFVMKYFELGHLLSPQR